MFYFLDKLVDNLIFLMSVSHLNLSDEPDGIFAEGVIAGGTAGVVVETALYPIDTIKTRLQAGFLDKTSSNED